MELENDRVARNNSEKGQRNGLFAAVLAVSILGWLAVSIGTGVTSFLPSLSLLLTDEGQSQTPELPPARHLEIVLKGDYVIVDESGMSTVKLKLSRPPGGSTTVSVSRVSGDADVTILSGGVATFSDADWDTYKDVVLAAAEDGDADDGLAGFVAQSGSLVATFTAREADNDRGQTFGSHAGRFDAYTGPETCVSCHSVEGSDMVATIHYQWKGPTEDLVNVTADLGKVNNINDFCTYPAINWLGKLTRIDGTSADGGCAKCHVGLGNKPSPADPSTEVDCLVCHSPDYRRTVAPDATTDSGWTMVPNELAMRVTTLEAASNIVIPGKEQCLTCHTKSGGGNNFKRGDIEEFHRVPTSDFDVHMASVADGGAGLTCISCHVPGGGNDHFIPGRGVDLAASQGTNMRTCNDASCHGAAPHAYSRLNKHTARLNCTSCHIPTFAKMAATDMNRDYSKDGELVHSSLLYEPYIDKGHDLIPQYAFFNGQSVAYEFDTPAIPDPNTGVVTMAAPVGDVNTAGAKINAFKVHEGTMARELGGLRLIPLKMGVMFNTGNNEGAITAGAEAIGWSLDQGYDYVNVERWMGLFHGVEPSANAVSCGDCHTDPGQQSRLDFDALGYTPRPERTPSPSINCGDQSGCHPGDNYYNKWSEAELFTRVHQKHVDGKGFDCASCHTFASAY